MTEENRGNEPETPTGETGTGQEQETGSPPVDTTDSIVKAAMQAEESAASEELGTEKEPKPEEKEKPPPYDQDPKWKAARAAEKNLQEVLSENDIEDVEELKAMLKTGLTLQEIVGNRDAKQLIQDADTLRKYQEYWAEQERLKEEEDLDPDERADKYKKELDNYKRQQAEKKAEKERVEEGRQAIEDYGNRANKVIENLSLQGDEAEMAKLFVGVGNPFNEVDVFDGKAVTQVVTQGVEKFQKFLAKVRQQAIDDYAAGKSKITPITPTETPKKTSVVKKKIPEGASVDQAFDMARQELYDLIAGGTNP